MHFNEFQNRQTLILFLLHLVFQVHSKYPFPLQAVDALGKNISVHDPSMIHNRFNNKYYLFSTGYRNKVLVAKDILGPYQEENLGIFPGAFNQDLHLGPATSNSPWAPDIQYFQNKFLYYYAIYESSTTDAAIGLYTSPRMEPNTWTDHGVVISNSHQTEPSNSYSAIDPSVLIVNEKLYLSFGSYKGGLFETELNKDGNQPIGERILTAYNPNTKAQEGSTLFGFNKWFYLLFSRGECCILKPNMNGKEYKIVYGRSKSPRGPFRDQQGEKLTEGGGTILLQSHGDIFAPGGQSIFLDRKNNRHVLVYNWGPREAPTEWKLGLNYLNFDDGWIQLAKN